MAKRKKRVNPILEARRLEAEQAANIEPAAETMRTRPARSSRRKKERNGLKLYPWVTALVAAYLIALFVFIYVTQGDDFPIEDVATSFVVMLLISSVVIALPTLLVWVFSKSQKASNFTCLGTVGLLCILIFPRVFLSPPTPPQQAGTAPVSGPPAAEQADAEPAAIDQGFAAIAGVIKDIEPLVNQWQSDSDAYVRAGAFDPRSLRGQYATDARILQLQNLIRLTQRFKAIYGEQEQAIRKALEPIDLTPEEHDTLLTAWRDSATPELFDQSRAQDLIVLDGHLRLLGLVKQYPEWQMRPDGYMIFVNHAEISDRYNELRAEVAKETRLLQDYERQIAEKRKLNEKKYNP